VNRTVAVKAAGNCQREAAIGANVEIVRLRIEALVGELLALFGTPRMPKSAVVLQSKSSRAVLRTME